jgi:hypothetical protein
MSTSQLAMGLLSLLKGGRDTRELNRQDESKLALEGFERKDGTQEDPSGFLQNLLGVVAPQRVDFADFELAPEFGPEVDDPERPGRRTQTLRSGEVRESRTPDPTPTPAKQYVNIREFAGDLVGVTPEGLMEVIEEGTPEVLAKYDRYQMGPRGEIIGFNNAEGSFNVLRESTPEEEPELTAADMSRAIQILNTDPAKIKEGQEQFIQLQKAIARKMLGSEGRIAQLFGAEVTTQELEDEGLAAEGEETPGFLIDLINASFELLGKAGNTIQGAFSAEDNGPDEDAEFRQRNREAAGIPSAIEAVKSGARASIEAAKSGARAVKEAIPVTSTSRGANARRQAGDN